MPLRQLQVRVQEVLVVVEVAVVVPKSCAQASRCFGGAAAAGRRATSDEASHMVSQDLILLESFPVSYVFV